MEPLKGYDRWLDPPDDGPAVCDYCQKEYCPDDLTQVGNTKNYACETCCEKHVCSVCEEAEAPEDFTRDEKAYCEVCFYKTYGCPVCGELPEYCICGDKK